MPRRRHLVAAALSATALTLSLGVGSANAHPDHTGTLDPGSRDMTVEQAIDVILAEVGRRQTTNGGSTDLTPDNGGSTDLVPDASGTVTLRITGMDDSALTSILAYVRDNGGTVEAVDSTSTPPEIGNQDQVPPEQASNPEASGTDFQLDPAIFGDLGTDTGTPRADTTSTTDGAPAGDNDATDAGDCEDDTGKDANGQPCTDDEDDEGGNDSKGSE